jgi:hypothetical protein
VVQSKLSRLRKWPSRIRYEEGNEVDVGHPRDKGVEQPASESTELFPGDVLRVRRELARESSEPATVRSSALPTGNDLALK